MPSGTLAERAQLAVQGQVALAQLEREPQRLNRALASSGPPASTRSGRRIIRWSRVRRAKAATPRFRSGDTHFGEPGNHAGSPTRSSYSGRIRPARAVPRKEEFHDLGIG
jgi:hypothetical protein